MGQSYRIRTELGITKSINVELEQEFEFLEILSLKLNQTDIYLRACSDYGVIVGRVTANNGLGLPNARVSIFIPIDNVDQSNPVISSIYPYKSPEDKNEDGYRYNLLPYEKSYSVHSATGTLPTRLDVLTGNTAFEIYEKYYKFTAKTNESGDYMIMGVPLGEQTIVMDVDLSDIGEFSLTPQDLIRIGRATEAQVAGNRFRTSNDLNSLPQIVNLSKVVEISPLWGEPSICQIAINRVDFDLRDEANIDIQPTAVFMGSIFSTSDQMRLRPPINIFGLPLGEKPKDNFGNLCTLETSTGQILAIRQTIDLDVSGNPILEEYRLEQNGNVIDENGAWLLEVPMNLDYFITNEFGDRVISYDPTIGIPTKGKYRFKVKWTQPANFTEGARRPYYLLPNVREYGWTSPGNDPNINGNTTQRRQLASSYYFGLDWSGYTNGFNSQQANTRINEIIDCEDTFYQFDYNRVYTPSSLIDQYKNGGRSRFIGIKEIDDNSCVDTVNKFPVNEGFRNFDLLYFIVSIILQIFQLISAPLIVVIHFILALWDFLNETKGILQGFLFALAALFLALSISNFIQAGNAYFGASLQGSNINPVEGALLVIYYNLQAAQFTAQAFQYLTNFGVTLAFAIAASILGRLLQGKSVKVISLPAITYPDCEGCPCTTRDEGSEYIQVGYSVLSQYSGFWNYLEGVSTQILQPSSFNPDDFDQLEFMVSSVAAGNPTSQRGRNINRIQEISTYKNPISIQGYIHNKRDNLRKGYIFSNYIPYGERINLFNLRQKYFTGRNQMRVTFDFTGNTGFHLDNSICISLQEKLETGQILSFVNPANSQDINFKYFNETTSITYGITGTPLNIGPSTYTVNYADPNNTYNELSKNYLLGYGSENTTYRYASDIEYFQVVTAMTMAEAFQFFPSSFPSESLPDVLTSKTRFIINTEERFIVSFGWGPPTVSQEYQNSDLFEDFDKQYLVILQRGVDPYSPRYNNKFDLNVLFGKSMGSDANLIVTASTKLNIPIQKLTSTSMTVQPFTVNGQNQIFYPSHFFRGGINGSTTIGSQWSAFTTSQVGFYSSLDASQVVPAYTPGGSPFARGYIQVANLGTNYQNAVISNSRFNMFNGTIDNRIATYRFDEPAAFYGATEDLSGGAVFVGSCEKYEPNETITVNLTYTYYPTFSATPMNIQTNTRNIFRTDRLPSSDRLDGASWLINPAILQQNLNCGLYLISDETGSVENIENTFVSTGAQQPTEDIAGQYAAPNVFDSFDCARMVSLKCYDGSGTGFTINRNCEETDSVVSGCYQFVRRRIRDIGKDIRNFNEWAYRFRFFYGLCRGVLSQTFTNNWVNGSLFMFPIQIDVTYDSNNRANPPNYPKRVVFFDSNTNNFYFRSSPFISGNTPSEFVGRPADVNFPEFSLNQRNLLFPTTIMNLGMKDSFYGEILFEPSTNAYVMNNLDNSSYSDTSDLVNLFVISRILNKTFLEQMLNSRDNSVNSLFSRNGRPTQPLFNPRSRLDADLAQLFSINSEVGLIPFTPEYYPFSNSNPNNSVFVYTQGQANPTIGVFYSSSTENLQTKDFLTPGLINFRFDPTVTAVVYNYGIKSQKVPFYQWQLQPGAVTQTIFGSEFNNWATTISDIVTSPYQSLNRRNTTTPNYFVPSNTTLDVNQRGYIFNKNLQGLYSGSVFQGMKTKFIVGAPFHFYFGVVKGGSALDKFKQKYLPNE